MLQNLTIVMVRNLLISRLCLEPNLPIPVHFLLELEVYYPCSCRHRLWSALIFLVSICLLLSHWHSPREQQGRTSTGVTGACEWKMRKCTGVAKSHCLPEASFLCGETPKKENYPSLTQWSHWCVGEKKNINATSTPVTWERTCLQLK